MKKNPDTTSQNSGDTMASSRKKDHLTLAFDSKVESYAVDKRFYYEPMLAAHPENEDLSIQFLERTFKAPMWISSMTGGTEKAKWINQRLAQACGEFGLGMGLGSCRQLLHDDTYLDDFLVRKWVGEQPLYANLGIAQIEQLVHDHQMHKVNDLLQKLEANGLIIHVNPTQEWVQPEGDRLVHKPIETIKRVLDHLPHKIIVKEVGQGFGPQSLQALMELPLAAIDFGAVGGTNFALLESLRHSGTEINQGALSFIGHTYSEMIQWANTIKENSEKVACKEFIISGGISSFLDGYYAIETMHFKAIYGQGAGFLKPALESYETLQLYIESQIKGLSFAKQFLKVR